MNLFDVNINYDMLDSRLNVYGGCSLILTSNDAPEPTSEATPDKRLDNRKISGSAGTKYQWTRKQSIRIGGRFIQYTDNMEDDRSYTEPIAEAMYKYTF